jgi:endonuclease III
MTYFLHKAFKIGKDYCKPRNPRCRECPLGELLGVTELET